MLPANGRGDPEIPLLAHSLGALELAWQLAAKLTEPLWQEMTWQVGYMEDCLG